jgi:hypothetical protein
MRRRLLLLSLGLLVVLSPASEARTSAKTIEIEVMSHARVTIPHDQAPKGRENKGDWIEYQDLLVATKPLFGKQKGVPVGWDKGTLTYTSATAARVVGTAYFPGQGSLRFRGRMKELPNGSSTVPIVGGGGKFTGARGVLIIGPGDQTALNTFKFTLSGGVA